ncbi:hypothetical protein ACFYRC_22135 [Streptomyces sp. NPDC005279]|uniref:hypothetical protein n=1 Tax=Streptomyces sp. NPDC005279 TaxID=3364712 RepID=UPI00369F5BB6
MIFSVAFPTGIAATFFAILIRRPYVLYAPKDYSKSAGVKDFVSALNSSRGRSIENMEAAIRSAMEETLPKILDEKFSERDRDLIVAEAIESAQGNFRHRFIRVSFRGIDAMLPTVEIPVDEKTRVQGFLNEAWSFTQGLVPPFTYGIEWVLTDPEANCIYKDMGSIWANNNRLGGADTRRLHDTGMRAGDNLEAIRLR